MKNRVLAMLLAVITVLSCVPVMAAAETSATVKVIVENQTYPVSEGAPWEDVLLNDDIAWSSEKTMMDYISEALTSHNYTSTGIETNYISEINGLEAFDGGSESGWMGTLNDWFVNEGFASIKGVRPGDEIRVMYTCAYGNDIGGDWSDNTTTLEKLEVTGGALDFTFASDTLTYTLTVTSEDGYISLYPLANNLNFQVRCYLNEKVTENVKGDSFIGYRASFKPADGDVIYIGVGEQAWGSMNENAEPTWYTVTVVIPEVDPEDPETPEVMTGSCGENLTYTLSEGVLTISGTGKMTDYLLDEDEYSDIPPWHDQIISSIVIEEGVTSVGRYAFYYDGDEDATVTSVSLPTSLSYIDEHAFCNRACDNVYYTSIRSLLDILYVNEFASPANAGADIYVDGELLTKLEIPEGEEWIYGCQFLGMKSLEEVVIASSVEGIGAEAFLDCVNLKKITIKSDSKLKYLGELCFGECEQIESITLPKTLSGIYAGAFAGCFSLKNVYYLGSKAEWAKIDIEEEGNEELFNANILYDQYIVEGLEITDVTDTTISIAWDKITGITGYEVYRQTGTGSFTKVATVTSSSTVTHKSSSLSANTTYGFKVRAYRIINKKYYYGPYTDVVSYKTAPKKVKPTVTALEGDIALIKVTPVDGADQYEIYRATSSNGPFEYIGSVDDYYEFYDYDITGAKTYYYKTKSVRFDIDRTVKSSLSDYASKTIVQKIWTAEVTQSGSTANTVSWVKISGASGYEIYRATSSTGSFTKVATVTSGSTESYKNTGLSSNKEYFYKVRAYKQSGSTKFYGEFSEVLAITSAPAKPSVTLTVTANNTHLLTFKEVAGAEMFWIFRSTSSSGEYDSLAFIPTNQLTFEDSDLVSGNTYYYKVLAIRFDASAKTGIVESTFSDIVSRTYVDKVYGVGLNPEGTSITVSWDQTEGASGYEVYRATSLTGSYTKITTITKGTTTYYKNTGLTNNKEYFYKVRAYKTVGSTKKYGPYSDVVSIKSAPAKTSMSINLANIQGLELKVKAVTGADGYEIYKKDLTTGEYILFADLQDELVTYDGYLESGKTYYYQVRAYRLVAETGTKIFSSASDVVSRTYVEMVEDLDLEAFGTNIELYWDPVSAASGYEVYRATSENGTYTKIATITKGSAFTYTNTGVTNNKEYFYKVRAYKLVGSTKKYGDYSFIAGVTSAPAKPTLTVSTDGYDSLKISIKPVAGAHYYDVYRSTSEKGEYVLINQTDETEFFDTGLECGKTYYYKAKAIRSDSGGVESSFSSVASKKVIPATLDDVTFTANDEKNFNISWNEIDGVDGYEVYRATSKTGSYSKIGTVLSDDIVIWSEFGYGFYNLKIQNVKDTTTYYFKLRSYKVVDGAKVYSNYSQIFSYRIKPVVTSFSITERTITREKYLDEPTDYPYAQANFNVTGCADYYQIFYSPTKTTDINKMSDFYDSIDGDLSYLSWKSTEVIDIYTGFTQYYKLQAVRYFVPSYPADPGAQDYVQYAPYKVYSDTKSITPAVKKTKITSISSTDTGSITIKWAASSSQYAYMDDVEYELYRSTSRDSGYKLIASFLADTDLSEYAYEDVNSETNVLQSGKTYYYKVRVKYHNYNHDEGKFYYSSYSDYKSVKCK